MAGLLDQLVTGSILSGDKDKNAQKYLDQQTGAFNGIQAPTLTPEQLQQNQWLGDLQPSTIDAGADVSADPVQAAQAATALAGPSAMQGITDNPAMLGQEQASLGALQDLVNKGGLNTTDAANLNQIQGAAAQQSRGQQDAIMQNMAARGMGGSGNELLAKLSASQNATNQAAQQGLDVAGQAQSRALQAMMQGGSLASQLQGQQFGEAAQKASAQDAISKFNAQNSNQMNQYNTAAQNQAGEFNSQQAAQLGLANRQQDLGAQQYNAGAQNQAAAYNNQGRQNLANQNTGIANQQNVYNTQQLPEQNFQNQMGLGAAKSGAAAAGANYWNGQSQQSRQGFQNFAQGAVGGGTQAASNYQNTGSPFQSAKDAALLAGAHGGKIPGLPAVHGDSYLNDKVPTLASPGEVQVPRTLVQHGSVKDIGSFVKHAPNMVTTNKLHPEDLSKLLRALSPKHIANSDAYRGQEMAEDDDGISSKLAALGLLSK